MKKSLLAIFLVISLLIASIIYLNTREVTVNVNLTADLTLQVYSDTSLDDIIKSINGTYKNEKLNTKKVGKNEYTLTYKGDASFDVISILDGTVTRVEENEMLGTTVEIRHSADIVSVYQGVSDVSVKKDEVVKQGQKIAVSGKSKIYSDVENGLHFEISHNGMIVNPSEYFNKTLKDL